MVKFWQNSRNRTVVIIFLSILSLAGVGGVTADQMFLRDSRILPNVQVAYIDVGGLTKDAAEKKLTAGIATGLPPVVLTDGKEVWLVPAREVNLTIDAAKNIESAYAVGRSQSFL